MDGIKSILYRKKQRKYKVLLEDSLDTTHLIYKSGESKKKDPSYIRWAWVMGNLFLNDLNQ